MKVFMEHQGELLDQLLFRDRVFNIFTPERPLNKIKYELHTLSYTRVMGVMRSVRLMKSLKSPCAVRNQLSWCWRVFQARRF